jgi:uncharacterized membrane protein
VSYYELLLFGHILAAAVWFGGGVILLVLAARFRTADDNRAMRSLFEHASFLSSRIFTPAGLIVLVLGILLVIEGPWTFDMLWVVLGLVGFAATFVTGLFVLMPIAKRVAGALERDGEMTPESAAETARMFRLARIDYTVIGIVIADMALKPTADDVGTLLAMAAVLAIVAFLSLRGATTRPAQAAREQA